MRTTQNKWPLFPLVEPVDVVLGRTWLSQNHELATSPNAVFWSTTAAKSRVIGVASTDVGNLNNGLAGTSIHLKLVGLMSKHP